VPSPRERRGRGAAAAALLVALAASCSDGDDGSDRAVVEVFGPIVGESGQRLGAILADLSAGTGVELRYVGVTSFNEQLDDRLQRGDRPGVALLPQPGLLGDLAEREVLQPLPADVVDSTTDQFPTALVDLVSPDGAPAAVWVTVDVKGLVWYRPDLFAARGLDVPSTLDTLETVSERVRTDGEIAPWCLTMEAGASTGWVGTDWVESFVLRELGPEQYDAWSAGSLAFDSPDLTRVFDELDALLRRPGAVAGGSRSMLTTPWEQAATQLLQPSPRCLMVHQADFLRREFPSGTSIGPGGQVDFFPLPTAGDGGSPLLVGGTLAVPLGDTQAVAEAMRMLASTELAERLDQTADFLSPHLGVAEGAITDATSQRLLQLLRSTTDVRFDGSDLMPPAVGTATFWAGMRAFFAGENVDTVLQEIQTGWSGTAT
jgi:alpha-glucoside transport system substrate-binding protein